MSSSERRGRAALVAELVAPHAARSLASMLALDRFVASARLPADLGGMWRAAARLCPANIADALPGYVGIPPGAEAFVSAAAGADFRGGRTAFEGFLLRVRERLFQANPGSNATEGALGLPPETADLMVSILGFHEFDRFVWHRGWEANRDAARVVDAALRVLAGQDPVPFRRGELLGATVCDRWEALAREASRRGLDPPAALKALSELHRVSGHQAGPLLFTRATPKEDLDWLIAYTQDRPGFHKGPVHEHRSFKFATYAYIRSFVSDPSAKLGGPIVSSRGWQLRQARDQAEALGLAACILGEGEGRAQYIEKPEGYVVPAVVPEEPPKARKEKKRKGDSGSD